MSPRAIVSAVTNMVNALPKAPHVFPLFYGCYLLKSMKQPDSKETYIGSTPSPSRRIRQHNGEVAAGAKKTFKGRPWTMQMLVHGFPSRQAALQFEWAWQNPHKSRYLRDASIPRGSKRLKPCIRTVRAMLRVHPFRVWPLHVKLFTEDAVLRWSEFDKVEGLESIEACQALDVLLQGQKRSKGKAKSDDVVDFPLGFTCSVELEGQDGASGHPLGSGRTWPIDEKDAHFIGRILAKNTSLINKGTDPSCMVCSKPVGDFFKEPLTTAFCLHGSCSGVAHLTCLSAAFLESEDGSSTSSTATSLIPRGGDCPSCGTYTLWGDIIKACYRRRNEEDGGLPNEDEDDQDLEADEQELDPNNNGNGSADESDSAMLERRMQGLSLNPGKPKSKSRIARPKSTTKLRTTVPAGPPRKRGRPPKPKALAVDSESGEEFDFSNITSSPSDTDDDGGLNPSTPQPPPKRKPGRPKKAQPVTPASSANDPSLVAPTDSTVRSSKRKATPAKKGKGKAKSSAVSDSDASTHQSGGSTIDSFFGYENPNSSPVSSNPKGRSKLIPSSATPYSSSTTREYNTAATPSGSRPDEAIMIFDDSSSEGSISVVSTPTHGPPLSVLGSKYRLPTPQALKIQRSPIEPDVIEISD